MQNLKVPIDQNIFARFGLVMILFLGIIGFANYKINQLFDNTKWVDHTYIVLLKIKDLSVENRSGARSFILTGNESDLDIYKAAVARIPTLLHELRQLTKDNPIQQRNLNLLESLIAQRIAMINHMIALKRQGLSDNLLFIDPLREFVLQIEAIEAKMQQQEYDLLTQRSQRTEASRRLTPFIINGFGVLSLIVMWGSILLISIDMAKRRRAEEAAKESEKRLNLALESGQMGFWDWDLVNDTVTRSLRHDQIFGHKEHLPAWSLELFNQALYPADREMVKKNIDEGLKTGRFKMECRIYWPDKSIHWILCHGHVYFDESRKPMRMTGIIVDITEPNKLKEELQYYSTYDELTGLYNRRGFKFLVEQKVKEARRSKEAIVLFLIDLNKMKNINDQFGHHAGDLALIDTAKLLKKSFRETDIISRWGGDEFVVLGVDTSDKDIPAIKQRLEANLNEYNLKTENSFKLSMSVGEFVANYDSQNSLEELIVEADKMMYKQKKTSTKQV